MKRYLFTNESGRVVHLIEGEHSAETLALFLHDFGKLFSATQVHETEVSDGVWVGWTLDSGTFVAPPPAVD